MDFPVPMFLVRFLLRLTDFLERHPALVKRLLRPIANAPVARDLLPTVVRAFMGATAFDCHVVDRDKGWITFGGVKETIHPGIFTRIMYETVVEALGEVEGRQAIFEIARESMYQEIKYGVEGNHVPGLIKPLIGDPAALGLVRSDPDLLRMTEKGMGMVVRLIADEGGWGRFSVSLAEDPIRVTVENSLDVRYLGPSPEPNCLEYLAITEGNIGYILGEKYRAREVECAAAGAPACVIELEREGA